MQHSTNLDRSKDGQQAQTIKVKPKWRMTALRAVYYLIMVAFLVFYMLPFWGTVMTSFKTNSEVMTSRGCSGCGQAHRAYPEHHQTHRVCYPKC